jgi:hypothetical protein
LEPKKDEVKSTYSYNEGGNEQLLLGLCRRHESGTILQDGHMDGRKKENTEDSAWESSSKIFSYKTEKEMMEQY